MRKTIFCLLLVSTLCASAQISENFSDGDFSQNPTWAGHDSMFYVNDALELQSKESTPSTSYLTTKSETINNATWECSVKILNGTSSANYASIYLVSDKNTLENCKAYYVQVGNTADEVSLYYQDGDKKTKIIDGIDKRLEDEVNVQIRVRRDTLGNWKLYSKRSEEHNFVLEGEAFHNELTVSKHFGLLTKKSKTRTNDYFFDNIEVSGNIGVNNDSIAPEIFGLIILGERSLELSFTEEVDISEAEFIVKLNDDEVSGFTHTLSEDKTRVTLNMPREIEADILYTVEAINVKDLVGNYLEENNWAQTAYARTPETSDLSFNEVMFENPEGSFEYVEIVNLTDKLLNMNGLIITTRNSDGNFETGNQFQVSYIQPQGLIAITENASAVLEHHKCPKYANVVNTEWNRTLKNDKNTIYLLTPDYEYMYDSMSYDAKWHHPLIRNAKGVSLEKINPTFDSATPSAWQSASSETHYGTPGHRNSQLRNPENKLDEEKYIRLDPEAFSPDGDGFEDLCYIYFEMPSSGFVANLSIYTPTGLQLCRIVENGVIGTEGNFIWNGLTQQGTNAEVGVYVLIFEAFNTNTGETIIRKMPIVINGR